jgi:hypothetical protein
MNNIIETIEKDIQGLSHNDSFIRVLATISSLREESIGDLHQASTEDIQQISGQILGYDQILKICDWDTLKVKHAQRLKDYL